MFTHLHTHTEYSLLDGLPKIKELLAEVKAHGMNSIAITDHGTMYGVIEFYKACLDEGIKPILGMEAYVSKGPHTVKERKVGKYKDTNHLTLIAKNFEGYRNLMKLTSIAHIEGFYYKPRIDKKTLKKHSKGLICLSGCMLSELSEYLYHDDYDKAKKTVEWFVDTFGAENYYLEIQRHNYKDHVDHAPHPDIVTDLKQTQEREEAINKGILKLSKEYGLPIVATNDVHYIKPEQAAVQDALVCVQTGKLVSDVKRMRTVDTPTFYLKSPQEMKSLFQDLPEAIENTQKIFDAFHNSKFLEAKQQGSILNKFHTKEPKKSSAKSLQKYQSA